ncbi:hypothetical protein P8452_13742 [Trifolium repens]|nr:hypothetical protein P8452_13742 [Trifolium repens]
MVNKNFKESSSPIEDWFIDLILQNALPSSSSPLSSSPTETHHHRFDLDCCNLLKNIDLACLKFSMKLDFLMSINSEKYDLQIKILAVQIPPSPVSLLLSFSRLSWY